MFRSPWRRLAAPALAAALLHGAAPMALAAPIPLTLLAGPSVSISDTSADGAAPVLGATVAVPLAGFDAASGVLLGVDLLLQVDPGQGLMAYRTESGGAWNSIATVRSLLQLGAGQIATGVLQRVSSDRDTLVQIGSDWTGLAYASSLPAALDAWVGAGSQPLSVTTRLSAFIEDGGGGSVAIASTLQSDGQGGWGPDADGLTGTLSASYSSIGHARLSFAGGVLQDTAAIAFGAAGGSAAFTLHALAEQARTGADFVRVDCSGDCGAFALDLPGFQGLAPGASVAGSLAALGSGPASARFTLWVDDAAGVGAAASHQLHSLQIDASVSAVPEPSSALMLVLGLLTMATLARRTRR